MLYAQTRNVAATSRLLRREGFPSCHENTLRRWVDEEGWDKIAQEYDLRAREADGLAAGIEDEIMRRNIRLIGDLEKQLVAGDPDAAASGGQTRARNLIDLQRQILDVVKLKDEREKRAATAAGKILPEQAGQVAKRVIDVLQEHPKVAALFREIGPELFETIEGRIEEIAP